MKILAVLSQKGGVGKTTISTCLAVAAEIDGKRCALIDLDPQATASFWKDVRLAETPAVESTQAVRLPAMIAAAKSAGAALVIIDGAAVQRDIAFEAAKQADLVIVPTKTAVFDTMSMTQTIELVRQSGKPLSVVLTFVPPAGPETGDAKKLVETLNVPLCPVTIGNRKAYFRAQNQGLAVQELDPHSKAATEMKDLYKYTCIQLYREGRHHDEQAQLAASGS